MAKKKVIEVEASNPEHDKLLETLKFTPCTYKISMWGYGGEKVMGTVDRKIYDYFKSRRLDLSSFAWDSDYAEENNIPEDMWPFPPGSWYECDDMGHVGGVSRNAGTLQIEDENGDTVYQQSLEDISGGDDDEPEWSCDEEVWIDSQPAGTVVFIGNSNEKGTFFEADLELKQPFNITKLTLQYDEVDGEEIVNTVSYDGEQIDNWGGNTDGKSSDFGFYIAHSQKETGSWEKYTNMDDITYEMTDWFPKKIKPVREGVYMIRTTGKNSWTHQAKWTGSKWVSAWTDEVDYETTDEIKTREWQGLASDPDADIEWDPATELQKIVDDFTFEQGVAELERAVNELGAKVNDNNVECVQCDWKGTVDETNDWDGQLCCPQCGEPVEIIEEETNIPHETGTDNPIDFPQAGWPFAGPAATQETKVGESKTWTIRTHYKKSCEQHEYFYNRELKGAEVKVIDGFRSCEYTFETEDGEFPDIQFTEVPGGDGKKDSIDLNSCFGSNVENTELVEMFDGGCWGDTEITGIDDEDEVERLTELVSEEGSYALEEDGDWYLSDTEVWVWGPLEIEDDDGNVRIVCADADGNMVDFVKEE